MQGGHIYSTKTNSPSETVLMSLNPVSEISFIISIMQKEEYLQEPNFELWNKVSSSSPFAAASGWHGKLAI